MAEGAEVDTNLGARASESYRAMCCERDPLILPLQSGGDGRTGGLKTIASTLVEALPKIY